MKKIVLLALMFPFCLCAQNPNLVKNGDGEAGTANWNAPAVAASPDAAHSGANGFKTIGTTVNSNAEIPVDTAKTYKLSGFFKSADDKKVNLFFGLMPYDAKNVPIYCHNINAVPDTDTELAEACQKGDTVLKIKDAGKWGAINKTMVIACNTDPSGKYKDLPNRDLIMDITKIEFNGKSWEVTLAKECGKALPAGTNIRLHLMGKTFIYPAMKAEFNSPGWVELTGTVKDCTKSGRSDTKFWPGTKSVRVLVSSYGGSVLFDDIKLEEVTDTAANVRLMPSATATLDVAKVAPKLAAVSGVDWVAHKGKADLAIWRNNEVDQVFVGFNLGECLKGLKPFWIGKDRYDRDAIKEQWLELVRQHPKGKFVIWLMVFTYPEWDVENPNELMRNEQGLPFVVRNHFKRVGNNPQRDMPKSSEIGERFAWSIHSPKLKQEITAAVGEFVKTIEGVDAGHNFAGILLGGIQDAQFYLWEPPSGYLAKKSETWGDYNDGAKRDWQEWLRQRYGSVKGLLQAWGNADLVSFDGVEIPSAKSLCGGLTWHDPIADQAQIDYKHFKAESRIVFAELLAQAVKAASSQPLLIGVSGGDNGCRSYMTANVRLYRSPLFDMFNVPDPYSLRLPPNGMGGISAIVESATLHGKKLVVDVDYRTWKTFDPQGRGRQTPDAPDTYGQEASAEWRWLGPVKNETELRNAWLRNVGGDIIRGHAAWLDPLSSKYTFDDPRIHAEVKRLVQTLKDVQPTPGGAPVAEMVVIYDERSVDYLKSGLAEIHRQWSYNQKTALDLSGVPYRQYYIDDLRDGLIPPAKLYLFMNQVSLDEETARAIKGLQHDGATLCFLQGTGYVNFQHDLARVSHVMGMEVLPLARLATVSDQPKFTLANPASLTPKAANHATGVRLPTRWQALGPFANDVSASDAVSRMKPVSVEVVDDRIDFRALWPQKIPVKSVVWLFSTITCESDCSLEIGAGADWWMYWSVNGKPVFDTLTYGNEYVAIDTSNYVITLPLKKGENRIEVMVRSGAQSFVLAMADHGYRVRDIPNPILDTLVADPQVGLAVVDKSARHLAFYPKTAIPGVSVKEHPGWNSVFIGSYAVGPGLIAALADYAGAWHLTSPGTPMAVNDRYLMVHPHETGPLSLHFPFEVGLSDIDNGLSSPRGKDHQVTLEAYKTYLIKLLR